MAILRQDNPRLAEIQFPLCFLSLYGTNSADKICLVDCRYEMITPGGRGAQVPSLVTANQTGASAVDTQIADRIAFVAQTGDS